jgi:phage shock protein E
MWIWIAAVVVLALVVIAILATYTYTGWNLLSSAEAARRIETGDIRTIVDVRTGIEWNRGHYPTAIHLPMSEITQQKISDLKANRVVREPVLVYCNTG